MGILRRGILGGFRNKVGSVVGVRYCGLDVVRSLPAKTQKDATQGQLNQRMKFALVTSMLSLVSDVIEFGFRSAKRLPSPMNNAVSYNLRHAVMGLSPNFSLDPQKLRFSKGNVGIPGEYGVESLTGARISVSWMDRWMDCRTHPNDQVTLVVYNPARQKFVQMIHAALRSDPGYSIQLPLDWVEDTVHVYMVLSAAKGVGKGASDTLYMGQNIVL
jgi:hypothetical protein